MLNKIHLPAEKAHGERKIKDLTTQYVIPLEEALLNL